MKLIPHVKFFILLISLTTLKANPEYECKKELQNYVKEKYFLATNEECSASFKRENKDPLEIWVNCKCWFSWRYYGKDFPSPPDPTYKYREFNFYLEDYYYSDTKGFIPGKISLLKRREEERLLKQQEEYKIRKAEKKRKEREEKEKELKKWRQALDKEKNNIFNKIWGDFSQLRAKIDLPELEYDTNLAEFCKMTPSENFENEIKKLECFSNHLKIFEKLEIGFFEKGDNYRISYHMTRELGQELLNHNNSKGIICFDKMRNPEIVKANIILSREMIQNDLKSLRCLGKKSKFEIRSHMIVSNKACLNTFYPVDKEACVEFCNKGLEVEAQKKEESRSIRIRLGDFPSDPVKNENECCCKYDVIENR